MKVNRNKLIEHLGKLHCNGQVPEVILTGPFATMALTVDQILFLQSDGMDKVQDLPDTIGIFNLGLLIRALKSFGEDDNESIEFDYSPEDFRIHLGEKGRGELTLVTASPSVIQTKVEDQTADAIDAEIIGDDDGIALPQSTVEQLLKTISLLKAEHVTVERNTKGTYFVVGSSQADHAKVPLPLAKMKKGSKSYELTLEASYVTAVLQQLDDFTATQIGFSGPDSLVRIWDGSYSYVLSPSMKEEE